VLTKFQELVATMGGNNSPELLAAGFIQIAVENMANAIKKISLQKGYDLSDYTLCTFGGAGGQVACLIAQLLTEMNELEVLAGRELEDYNQVRQQVSLKYQGSDATLAVNFSDQMRQDFEREHQRRYGFKQEQKALIVESIAVELIQTMDSPKEAILTRSRPMGELPPILDRVAVFMANQWRKSFNSLQRLTRVCGKKFFVGVGCGVWGVGFYQF